MNEPYDSEPDAGRHPHIPAEELPEIPGPHTGAPEDIPEHNTAPDGRPGDVQGSLA